MAADGRAPAPATQRSYYDGWIMETLRYGDTDAQGHVNNAVFATFCESGRSAYFHAVRPPGANFVIVRLELDFRAELFYPGTVDIGTRVLTIGNSSVRLGQGVFKGELCAATAECVMVLVDDATHRPVPFPPPLRAWMEERRPR
jgi:acyl-CoA thioester hydrolase